MLARRPPLRPPLLPPRSCSLAELLWLLWLSSSCCAAGQVRRLRAAFHAAQGGAVGIQQGRQSDAMEFLVYLPSYLSIASC
jgi:hypothetical protein